MKINKKTILSSIILSSLFLSGCEKIEGIFSKEAKKEEALPPTTVGILMSNATTNPFFVNAYQAFQAIGQSNPSITVRENDASDNQEAQFSALDQFLNSGAQAIVINMVDAKQGDKVIEKVRAKNVPVVFFNRSPGYEVLSSYDKAVFVDGDAVQGGVLQGLSVLKSWRNHPEWDKNQDGIIQFAMLMGIPGNPSAEARTKWSIGTMSSYPNLAVPTEQVALRPAFFREKEAFDVVNTWIHSGKIDQVEVILANNDVMAIGAIKALRASNKSIPVFGIDAIPAALELLGSGQLAGTVVNDAALQAETSVLAAVNLAHNKEVTHNIDNKIEYQTILVPYKSVQ